MFQAFFWICDDCGQDNFERAVTVPAESIDPANLPDNFDPDMIEDWADMGKEVVFNMAPDRVKCRHCNAEFKTANS